MRHRRCCPPFAWIISIDPGSDHVYGRDAMGLTVLALAVANPARPDITQSVDFLVDSGAIYSIVPAPVLRRLGIEPLAEQEFRLANGTRIVRKKRVAVFRYGDRVGGADVIFGEEGDASLLGAFTLEALGLALDPLRRELTPLPMVLARMQRQPAAASPPTWRLART